MIVENAFTVAAPMDVVFDALRDVRTMLPCFDARVVEIVDGHTARGELHVPVGGGTVVLSGTLSVGAADREAGAITFEAVARAAGDASAQARMAVRLRESAAVTTVSVHADVDIADVGVAVNPGDTDRVARELFSRLGSQVADRIARAEEPAVRGTVKLMADAPVQAAPARSRGVAAPLRRHPWIIPAALLGAAAVVLVLLRRAPTVRR